MTKYTAFECKGWQIWVRKSTVLNWNLALQFLSAALDLLVPPNYYVLVSLKVISTRNSKEMQGKWYNYYFILQCKLLCNLKLTLNFTRKEPTVTLQRNGNIKEAIRNLKAPKQEERKLSKLIKLLNLCVTSSYLHTVLTNASYNISTGGTNTVTEEPLASILSGFIIHKNGHLLPGVITNDGAIKQGGLIFQLKLYERQGIISNLDVKSLGS